MASLQTASYLHGRTTSHSHGKITKHRGSNKTVNVKPLLKKFHSAHSEKNSLDLDRTWEDQAPSVACSLLGSDGRDSHDGSAVGLGPLRPTGTSLDYGPRAARDVSSGLASDDLLSRGYGSSLPGAGEVALGGTRLKYAHARSASNTSHVSTATSGSGRNGHFVHPFQQTPLTSTPSLPYASSRASLETATPGPRDYSPTIAENEHEQDGSVGSTGYFSTATSAIGGATRSYRSPVLPHSFSQSDSRSSVNNSSSDVTQLPRVTASARSSAGAASRSASAAAMNHSNRTDLPLGKVSSCSATESSAFSVLPTGTSPSTLATNSSSSSTAIGSATMPPLRTSLDMSGFRLRSRSELDTATRQEQVRQARRKFEEKERVKEEKFAREEVRKRERADTKEAQRFERANAQGHGRKSSSLSGHGHGVSSASNSSSVEQRGASSTHPRKSLGQRTASYGPPGSAVDEKSSFASRDYNDTAAGESPQARTEDVRFETTRRNTTKRKTTGAWTAFVLWLRTRLFKMGRR